jgi:2-iminobutanoate/2-iminopropanoate deaminase
MKGDRITMEHLVAQGSPPPDAPYSDIVVSGNLVAIAGQVGFDQDGSIVSPDIAGQTRQALDNMRRCLAAAGCTFADVLKVNAFLVDLDDFAEYNSVYVEYFKEPYPARTTVGAKLAVEGLKLEIEALAIRPNSVGGGES